MAESNATQVILTDDGLKITKAQNKADSAASGVTNLNDPNLMSVIEKQNNVAQFAGLTSQYNVIVQNAKDDGIDTTALTVAYNNLNQFMAGVLADPNHASDVDRVTYKKYQDAYNEELAKLQNSLQNNTNNKFTSAASAASQAASTANIAKSAADSAYAYANSEIAVQSTATAKAQNKADDAFSKAQAVGDKASKEIAVQSTATAKAQNKADDAFSKAQAVGDKASAEIVAQSTATAKAQSTADNAFSKATTAIDTGKVTSQAVTDLKDGSKLTIAELENGLATKVANSDYASYKTQTASQIGQLVTNGAFSAYQQTTADLISQKVATKDFTAYQATTAKSIESKVESKDFNTYKSQTDKSISSKVSSIDFNNLGGGRNYLLNSKLITITPTGQANYDYRIYLSDDFWKNPDRLIANNIKVSFTMHVQNALSTEFNSNVYFGASPWYSMPISYPAGTTKLQKYKLTYSITDSTYTTDNLFIRFQDTNTADNPFIIENVTLSIGSNFVDWTPAPEDQATQSQITQLSGEIEQKVDSGNFSTYKTQTANLIGSKVDNGDFSTYKTQTADLISAKVATKDFSSYKDETAKAISSKVESRDFNTYKTQTTDAILSKVSKKDANNVNLIPYSAMPKADITKWYGLGGGVDFQVVKHAFYHNGADPLYELNTAGSNEVFAESPRFKINANTTYTFQLKGFASYNVSSMDVYILGRLNGDTSDYTVVQEIIASAKLSNSGLDYRTVTFTTGAIDEAYIRIDNNGSTNGKVAILGFTELKLEPGDTATPYVYGGQDSMISQMSDDINLRVAKDDLISQINIQARNTLISSGGQLTLSGKNVFIDSNDPVIMKSANIDKLLVGKKLTAADIAANTFTTNNGTFTVYKDGSITAKNMTLIGGTLTSPIINASTINGAIVNGTTFHGGDVINDANNTSKLYPTTISSDGHIYTTQFNYVDAMQTDLSTGALTTKYRAINTTNPNNHYEAYDTTLQADQIALFAGHTNGKDMSFTQSVTGNNQDGYVLISPLNGMTLHGDNQQITFNGTSDDVKPKGVIITPYGNINPNGTQNIWYVGNGPTMKTASFGMNADQSVPISFYRQTLVDEIGAMGNRLPNGRLFLHATDNNAQMYLLNDGSPAFVSPTIYNRTYSNGANMFITSSGRVGRSTSASKYKLAIARSDDTSQADRLMTLNPASWNDKVATEKMAESLSNGEIPVEPEINLKRHYGLIAEDLRDAGLDEFLITGKDGQIEGIEYDRLWTVLIPKIKQLNNRINELERKTL